MSAQVIAGSNVRGFRERSKPNHSVPEETWRALDRIEGAASIGGPPCHAEILMKYWFGMMSMTVWPAFLGCSTEDSSNGEEPVLTGAELFQTADPQGNTFACGSCHALTEPAPDGLRRPGHPLGDAANRPSYKNGQLDELLDAVNICRTEWMGAAAWTPTTPEWLELESFLGAQAPDGPAPALSFAVVPPPAQTGGGDPMVGKAVFNGSCAVCHGQDANGTDRAPPLVGALLNASLIAGRVRTSGRADSAVYGNLTGGRMPFWAADRLSDDELRDVVAFVLANDPRGGNEGGGGNNLRDCPTTHPKIGQVATLSRFAHQVGGTATIVDDCTIRIDDFTFDGQGIDVRFYSGLGGDYSGGFSMSETDLRRDSGYQGETVFAQLPEGRILDELDGISVWCVPVGVSFGDGLFGRP